MTPIEQVLAAAKAIAATGKTPSLALIKSKVGNALPMPILIQGLQRFKALTRAEIEALQFNNQQPDMGAETDKSSLTLEGLQQEVQTLGLQQQALIARIEVLESLLKEREPHKCTS
jgi:hypothetical protein